MNASFSLRIVHMFWIALMTLCVSMMSTQLTSAAAPTSVPYVGAFTGGAFSQYFRNIIENPCPSGSTIAGYNTTPGMGYGLPNCMSSEGYWKSNDGGSNIYFTGAGNVAIGTNSPSGYKFTVINGDNSMYVQHRFGGIGGATSSIWAFDKTWKDNGLFYTEGSPDYVDISPNGGGITNPVMRISGNGNVGIGTNNPGEQFTIGSNNLAFHNGGEKAIAFNSSYVVATNSWNKISGSNYQGRLHFNPSNGDLSLVSSSNNNIVNADDNRLFIRGTTGNIGIGTTSPVEKLDIAGHTRMIGSELINNTAPTIYLQDTDNRSSMIHANANSLYFLRGSGNNSTTWTPYNSMWPLVLNMEDNKAFFGGQIFAKNNIYVDSGALMANWNTNEGGQLTLMNGLKTGAKANQWALYNMTGPYGDGLGFWSYPADGTTGGCCHMNVFFHDNGNVGIGTNNPFGKLTSNASADPTNGIDSFALTAMGSYGGGIGLQDGTGNFGIWLDGLGTAARFGFGSSLGGLSTTFSLLSNGNVGIGVVTPSEKLDIAGNVKVSGSVTSGGGFIYSDRNLKTSIVPINNALEKILQLGGYSFVWKDSGRKDIGVIAQEVEIVFPDAVHTDTKTGLKSVEYANLVAPLIEAIQEQQDMIRSQDERIRKLEQKLGSVNL